MLKTIEKEEDIVYKLQVKNNEFKSLVYEMNAKFGYVKDGNKFIEG